jgi:amino acid adenylation domain-containing protein
VSVADLVSHLRNLDIRLSAEGERVRVNAPKGVLTESLRAQIVERKQELLQFLSHYEQSTASIPPPVIPRSITEPAPLSFAQERLWFLEQLEPASAVYNICRASRILGKLNPSAIESSLNEIVRRHKVLRSSIRVADGRPVQVVQPPFELNLSVMDLHATSDVEREPEIRQRIQQAAESPFDFAAGRFLRAHVLRVADDEHVLILATHHIVSDAWSMGILTRELWSLYEAYAEGKSSQLEEVQIQYGDFATWQREWLQGEVLEGQLSYWKEQLKDLSHLNMPTDRPRPARQSFEAARIPISLPETLTAAIHELSNQAGVTPFMILLAAFEVLLYRYCGQEDVVVGSPIANRGQPEFESLIGFFVNTLVLRADLSGNPTFNALLTQVRDVCLCAYSHQDMPFDKLVHELQPQRDLSRNPLFEVMFVLQNATRRFSGIPGLLIEPIEIESARSPFDLSVFLRERDGKYIGYFEYSTALFNRDRIERMARHLQTLIEGIIANPDQPISTLPILTDLERHQILIEWNETAVDYPRDRCIHELVENQVERTPNAVAVSFQSQKLTYRELNARANQLAHYLKKLGVAPEKLVGIFVDRSLDMVVGLLGILKAGGAYLPLDSVYPKQRLEFMLQDADVAVLLTLESVIADEKWKIKNGDPRSSILDSRRAVVCLDRDWLEIQRESGENPRTGTGPENLAYVIYTSGSTGQPKGVAIEHRSLVNCVHYFGQRMGVTSRDVLLAVTTISFDIAALELYLPLIAGGQVVVANREAAWDGAHLAKWLSDSSATIMQATPLTWRLLLDGGWQGSREFKVLCGGEALPRQLADRLQRRGEVFNLFGPTETTVWSMLQHVEPSTGPITIGHPIANTKTYVLDSNLEPVPIGVPGELHIGGDGLARGYLNRPEFTTEKFIGNPFSSDARSRIYKSGDRVRYLSDGNIEWLGRTDNQVKMRGYRIELGEIESTLNLHPAVVESVVILGERTSSTERHLIGYVVPKPPDNLSTNELRQFLSNRLPEYMIPSEFVKLESLPTTPNGKVDRNLLVSAKNVCREGEDTFVEPKTQNEKLMAKAWQQVLKLKRIGLHDNFFELGGHSLLAISILVKVNQIFNKEVSLRAFFTAPTIFGLTKTLENIARTSRDLDLPPIKKASRKRLFFLLSSTQKQLWILDRLLPGTYFLNIPYAYRLTGQLDIKILRKSLQTIIGRHEAFHLVFVERGGQPVQFIGRIPRAELPTVDLRKVPEEYKKSEFDRLSKSDASTPFDLEAGRLFRFQLIRLADEEYVLLVTIHHIVCDDWSMEIFRQELIILYDALAHGRRPLLPKLKIHFLDFLCWQRELSKGELLNNQLAYWKTQLNGLPRNPIFRSQRGARKKWSFRTATQSVEIDPTQLCELRRFVSAKQCTPFMFLLSVLNLSLYVHTGEQDIPIGSTVANRDHRDTQNLIGNFLNAVVFRTRISVEDSFAQFLEAVKTVCLEGLKNQNIPFAQIAKAMAGDNPKSRIARVNQVMFVYQKRSFESATCSGITFAPLGDKYRRPEQTLLLTGLDLILELREASTKLTGSVTYKINIINDRTIATFISNFQRIFKCVLENPGQKVKDIFQWVEKITQRTDGRER